MKSAGIATHPGSDVAFLGYGHLPAALPCNVEWAEVAREVSTDWVPGSTGDTKTTLIRHLSVSWDIDILRSFTNHNYFCWREDQSVWRLRCRDTKAKLVSAWKLVQNRICPKDMVFLNQLSYFRMLGIIQPLGILTWKCQKWVLEMGGN